MEEEKRKEFYRVMLEDSDRLLGTIEQVLRTGRVGPGNRKVTRSRVDLNTVITECVQRARMLHGLNEEQLQYRPNSAYTISGDLDEVRAAVSNLIDNAVKYSNDNVQVRVDVSENHRQRITVRVRDEGAGIARSDLKRIFKRFYRASGPLATRVKGTGLGLYIVRSVAKRHGGRAWAESEGPGHGSTFILELPTAS